MDNASQLVGDVMAILNALMEVMKLIAVSLWITIVDAVITQYTILDVRSAYGQYNKQLIYY